MCVCLSFRLLCKLSKLVSKLIISWIISLMTYRLHSFTCFLQIDWTRYMKVLLQGINNTYDLATDNIIIVDESYFQNLAWLLASSQIETIRKYYKTIWSF